MKSLILNPWYIGIKGLSCYEPLMKMCWAPIPMSWTMQFIWNSHLKHKIKWKQRNHSWKSLESKNNRLVHVRWWNLNWWIINIHFSANYRSCDSFACMLQFIMLSRGVHKLSQIEFGVHLPLVDLTTLGVWLQWLSYSNG